VRLQPSKLTPAIATGYEVATGHVRLGPEGAPAKHHELLPAVLVVVGCSQCTGVQGQTGLAGTASTQKTRTFDALLVVQHHHLVPEPR
jgi:hypothetical protein